MTELDKRKCVPCEGGLDALTREKAESYLKKLDRNSVSYTHLRAHET